MGEGPGAKAEVARVFFENDGENRVAPESTVRTVESGGAKTLGVALGSLPEFWIGIARLTETGDKPVCHEDKWIDRAFKRKVPLLFRREAGRNAGGLDGVEVWHHPENALMLFLLQHTLWSRAWLHCRTGKDRVVSTRHAVLLCGGVFLW